MDRNSLLKQNLYEDIYEKNFSFGENWQKFLKKLDEEKIEEAKNYLLKFLLCKENIEGKTIIDIGCGSGLMSLAFHMLGAKKVVSVDIDKNSIECTKYLKSKYFIQESGEWEIINASVMDVSFLKNIGKFDVIYSRGVLHHTGDMWKSLNNILYLSHDNSLIYIAIYNNNKIIIEGTSNFWKHVKYICHKSKFIRHFIIKPMYIIYIILGLIMNGKNPIKYIKNYKALRGMDFFTDIEDWLGGYPYEYASFTEIKNFYESKGFKLINYTKARSLGCNEFLFKK